jgi:hypothetical protein
MSTKIGGIIGDCVRAGEEANFPAFLLQYLQIDRRDGWRAISFCYPLETGSLLSELRHANELLQDAQSLRGPARKAAMRSAAELVARISADHDETHRQWSAYVDRRVSRYAEAAP